MQASSTSSPAPLDVEAMRTALVAINQAARFNSWLGMTVLSADRECVEVGIQWKEDFGQYAGFLHAGIVGALIETACGFASTMYVGRVLASHYSVNCLRPALGSRFLVRARVTKPGRRQTFASAELFAFDGEGKESLVATGETILVAIDTKQ